MNTKALITTLAVLGSTPSLAMAHPAHDPAKAGSIAFKEAMKRYKPKLLEPVMAVEVITPEDYLGDVMGNLNGRRGRIESMEPLGNAQVIRASVPLSEMFGYATDLRSMSQGRAEFTMQFDRYEEVPQSIASDIIDARG